MLPRGDSLLHRLGDPVSRVRGALSRNALIITLVPKSAQNTSFAKALNFLFGCCIVFSGVWTLTHSVDPDHSDASHAERGGPAPSARSTAPHRSSPLRVALDPNASAAVASTSPVAVTPLPRPRRTASGSAPRTLSASAGYLLLASPSSRQPAVVFDALVEDQAEWPGSNGGGSAPRATVAGAPGSRRGSGSVAGSAT